MSCMLRSCEGFIIECFEPYGITKDNIDENLARILIDSSSHDNVEHFFLDGTYVFSIDYIVGEDQNHILTTTYRKFKRDKSLGEEEDL